jgi:hypothetical protein
MAVVPEVSPSIVRPTKFAVLPVMVFALNIFFVSHLPSDALKRFSLG